MNLSFILWWSKHCSASLFLNVTHLRHRMTSSHLPYPGAPVQLQKFQLFNKIISKFWEMPLLKNLDDISLGQTCFIVTADELVFLYWGMALTVAESLKFLLHLYPLSHWTGRLSSLSEQLAIFYFWKTIENHMAIPLFTKIPSED